MKNKKFMYCGQLVCFCFEKSGEGDCLWERAVWFSGDSTASWPVCLRRLCHRALITGVFNECWGWGVGDKEGKFCDFCSEATEFRKER